MRRHAVISTWVLPALVLGLAVTVIAPTAASAEPAFGAVEVVAGGGRGWSGPASSAEVTGEPRVDAASDGTLLVAQRGTDELLRVDPTTDRLQPLTGPAAGHAGEPIAVADIADVAASGSDAILATSTGIIRITAEGERRALAPVAGVVAIDVGAGGVVWAATARQVLRILADGTVEDATPAEQFGRLTDLAVASDGSTAYVLESAPDRWAVYPVTSAGAGARVAGTLTRSDSLRTGFAATSASTESVRSITTDGSTIAMSSPEYQRVVRFPVGGTITQVLDGHAAESVTVLGADLAVGITATAANHWRLDRVSTAGTVRGRLLGLDPAAPWSPDGVRADDAEVGEVRGAAALPSGLTVFTTRAGLVREVGLDGRLHTRASLAPLATRGKVAIAADGTAYVVTDAGALTRVPTSGGVTTVSVAADVTDVEVRSDGTLVVADGSGGRVVEVLPGGSTRVLATGLSAPTDLGLDGDAVLVAEAGVRRVTSDGRVGTVLTGGNPSAVAAVSEGVWTTPDTYPEGHRLLVSSGAMLPVRADFARATQVQAVDGDALIAGGGTVRLVTDPGLPAPAEPLAVTATPGGGRITLHWDESLVQQVTIMAKRGTTPPADRWDGEVVRQEQPVLTIGDEPLRAGEVWSFAIFPWVQVSAGEALSVMVQGAPTTVTAAALTDTTPPPGPVDPEVLATRTKVGVSYRNPLGDDFSHSVVRMLPGAVAPSTPDEGVLLLDDSREFLGYAAVPSPVRGEDYAISIFTVDLHGNTTRWSVLTRLDWEPPAQVTDVRVTPSFTSASGTMSPPTDADYAGITYAVAPGDAVPSPSANPPLLGLPVGVGGLAMGTEYTLAVWTHDRNGNVSEPVLTRFRTLLDATPPGPVTGLAATGGAYRADATWTPPTDEDVKNLQVTLVDLTKAVTGAPMTLPRTATGTGWPKLPGGHAFEVRVTATDVNGNVSEVATATTQTLPDDNGAPEPIDPASVTVTTLSSSSMSISFPKPAIPDLRFINYGLVPVGEDPSTWSSVRALTTTTSPTVKATITFPEPLTAYRLVLDVWDHNGNRARTVVGEVKGVFTPSELPTPALVLASSRADNEILVSWGVKTGSTRPPEWVVTATSGELTRTVVVGGTTLTAGLLGMPGQRDWTVSVRGRNAFGVGDAMSAVVRVGDSTPPAAVTNLVAAPSYDTVRLSWTNPSDADFDRVVVTRHGATLAETKVVYDGKGTSAVATGLVAGRLYSYLVATYDALGNTSAAPSWVQVRQSTVTMSVGAGVKYKSSTRASGVLAWNGVPVAGATVVVQSQRPGATSWSQVTTVKTTSTGAYAVTLSPTVTTRYRVLYAGSGSHGGAVGPVATVTVAPSVTITASRTSFRFGSTATLSTTVGPNHKGSKISLQRWTGKTWSTVTTRTLTSSSTASASVRPTTRGTHSYRWVLPAHSDHSAGVSATVRLKVT